MHGARFGDLLRRHRVETGLTQAALGEQAGISEQTVSSLERGARTRPRRHTVLSLADAMRLPDTERDRLLNASTGVGDRRRGPRDERSDREESEEPSALDEGLTPRALPPDVWNFTGRTKEVDELRELVVAGAAAGATSAVGVSAIEGMGGIGKTTLAVHVAHLIADEFPDGQIYVNLRGFGPGDPMSTSRALGLLLATLGVHATPSAGVEQLTARFRSVLAGKRVLLVLDNAASAEQVLPLLPGTLGCAVIVTSRRSVSTLPASCYVHLDVLPEDDAVSLLGAIVGEHRINAEYDAAVDVVRRCGRLPLAIRIAAARLVARPQWPVAVLADYLSDERHRLDELQHEDVDVRASLSLSLRQLAESANDLDQAAAAAFPLLGLSDGPDIGLTVASRLLDRSEAETRRILGRLVDASLLEPTSPHRYRLHDLLRTLAREHAAATVTAFDRTDALIRVLVLFNSAAWQCWERWFPQNQRKLYRNGDWIEPRSNLGDKVAVLEWLDRERQHVLAALRQATSTSSVPAALTSQLAMGLLSYHKIRQCWADLIEISRLAIEVAEAAGDQVSEGFGHHDFGCALAELGHPEDAEPPLKRAVGLFRSAGDVRAEAMTLCNLGYFLERAERREDGIVVATRALELNQSLGDLHRVGQAWLLLGLMHYGLGHLQEGMACIEKGRAAHRRIGYTVGIAESSYRLGIAHRRSGRYQDALDALCESIASYEGLGTPTDIAEARVALAETYLDVERYAAAVDAAQAVLRTVIAPEDLQGKAHSVLGSAYAALDEPAKAIAEWERALAIFDDMGSARADDVRLLLGATGVD